MVRAVPSGTGTGDRPLAEMALDPYRRISRRNGLSQKDKRTTGSRVPWLVGAVGLIAMLAIVYQLSVMGISSRTLQDFGLSAESPP